MEEENKQTEEQEQEQEQPEANKSLLEKTIEEREKTEKMLAELKLENDRREKLTSENMLAGSAGGNVPPKEPRELTAKEYKDKVLRGEI